ncbi:MAG TPA: hypothetical protein PLS29_08755, partial [Acidimicrobiales bacterium]|nr:hypothetical protein [Acidimicrobiales bacterium]
PPVGVGAPLAAFAAPSAPSAPVGFRSARLDRGRLHAPEAIGRLGWPVLCELDARLVGPSRVRLRRRPVDDRPVRATARAHVDATGRVLIPSGLRHHLGVAPEDQVVVWVEAEGGEPGVLVVVHPGVLVGALSTLDA